MSWLCDLIAQNSPDPRQRIELSQQFLVQLQVSHLPSDSTLLNDFCDLILQWLSCSNFKVALNALEILGVAVDVSGDVLAPYLIERTPALVERLGDGKQSVREAAIQLLVLLANAPYSNVQIVFEKVAAGLTHRQWLVRIGAMQVIKNILEQNKFYVEIQVNRVVPTLCKLMEDPNNEVREATANTLVYIFCQYGDHVAISIKQRQLITDPKYQMLMSRLKDAQEGIGQFTTTPSTSQRTSRPLRRLLLPQKPGTPSSANRILAGTRKAAMSEDQENLLGSVPPFLRASSVPAHRRPITVSNKNSGSAGAVSDETFQKAFLEVPKCSIFSAKELKEKLDNACATLQNANLDWDKRVNALKVLRSIIIGGAFDFTDFTSELREMESAFLTSIKDLRSQVCREGCVTLAFYCEKLELKMAVLIEALMPALINLLQNSAKVMASSAHVALQYVVKYVRSPKLMPHLKTAMASKSRDIRRNVAALVLMALTLWDGRLIEKNISIFMDCIKAGINDADPETRNIGRNMFSHLDQEYRHHAEILYKSLDPSKQRSLSGIVSQSSSSQSIVSEKDSLPITQKSSSYSLHKSTAFHFTGRSTSDIDTGSARRAYSQLTRGTTKWRPMPQINGTPISSTRSAVTAHRFATPSSTLRKPAPIPRTPPGNVARSQPGSRSTSPSQRIMSRNRPSVPTVVRNRSHVDDLEDISAAGDSLKFEVAELNNALACCAVSSASERKEGLKALYTIVSTEKHIDPLDLKKITERLNSLISEGSHKLLQAVSDLLIKLVQLHHEELNDWLNLLIPRLLMKYANDVLASNQDRYRVMLDTVRQCFDPEQQLHAVFKFIQDPVRNNVNFKIKHGLLKYLHEVMSGVDRALSYKNSEVRSAILKIFQWLDDPKNAGLRDISERVICDMFSVNASDFTAMMATFDNDLRNQLQEIIQRNSLAKPKTNGFNSNDTHALIHDTASQINDFVEGRRLPGSPIRYESSFSRSPLDNGIMRRQSREDPSCSLSGYILDPERLTNDEEMQEELIKKIGEELSHSNERTAERLQAMNVLSQITRESLFSLWDKYFKKILLLLVENLNDSDASIRRTALKLLKEICYSQAPRFNYYAEMVFMRVLDATADESKIVVSAAEECGSVLATHVSSVICRKVLLAVIKSTDTTESKIQVAIKMLTKVLESLSPEELLDILEEVAPPIVEAYNYESSSIRKESVGCLVKMHKIVGKEAMLPYIGGLNRGKRALLDVYLNRMRGPSPVS